MRLFLLPISTRRSLIYCQRLNIQLSSKQTYVERVTNRAGAVWVKWESAGAGWQQKVTAWGNELFKRIPYEEWGLKSIPPLSARRATEDVEEGMEETEVVYPSSIIKPGTVFDVLYRLATKRQALHRRQMWLSIAGMPITGPFALIPVLPNIPFFYLLWRTWSHWRALGGSKHIEYLLEKGLIKSAPSEQLSRLYEKRKISSDVQNLITDTSMVLDQLELASSPTEDFAGAETAQEKSRAESANPAKLTAARLQRLITRSEELSLTIKSLESDQQLSTQPNVNNENVEEKMVLFKGSGRYLADLLQVHELEIEVERAVEQVQKSLTANLELKEKGEGLAAATKEVSKESGA